MARFLHVCFTTAAAVMLISCAQNRNQTAGAGDTQRPVEPMDDQYEVPPPRDTVPEVMQAKLANAQAVLEGLALADYAQIETNALALKRISQGGDWLVQDSATYFDFSSEFRDICNDLANHSRAQNMQALTSDYANLVNSCVACHDYLRKERQTKDMPGRISMGLPPRR
ncbi:MAG: hypothetical protein L0Y42_08740 [Phycisphaerales bacterium]|nr:hypothetical protein [Phycisphaerales bacterium]